MGAFAVGDKVLRLMHPATADPVERFLLRAALGLGIVSYIIFFLGHLRLLVPLAGWALLVVLSAIMFAHVLGLLLHAGPSTSVRRLIHYTDGWVLLVVLAVILLSVLNLVVAISPPSHPDVLAYHLMAPRTYIQDRAISFYPIQDFANPMGAEMLYLFGLLLGVDRMPGVLNWIISLCVSATAWMYARYVFGSTLRAAWTAILLICALPISIYLSTISKSDMFTAFYGALSFYVILRWRESRQTSTLVLAGIFAGLSAGTKYLGAMLVPAGLLALFADWFLEPPRSPMSFVGRVFVFTGGALFVAFPWYLQNLMATGNPFWPFFNDLLGGRYQTVAPPQASVSTLSEILRTWFFGPWTATMLVGEVGLPFGKAVTPTLLAFVPVAVMGFRDGRARKHTYALVAVWCFALYTQLKVIAADDRFLYPLYPVLTAVASSAVISLWNTRWIVLRMLALGGIAVPAVAALAMAAFRIFTFAPVVLGREPVSEFLAVTTPLYRAFEWANRDLPADARVAVFTKYPYYLDRPIVEVGGFSALVDYRAIHSADEWLTALQRQGVTFILVDEEGLGLLQAFLADTGVKPERWLTALVEAGRIRVVYESDVQWPQSRSLGGEGPLVRARVVVYEIVP